ncbi:BlaI/MecI/CopY family transcriptional regulator [Fulvivirga ligni]|uniref:BlaI/MecI/CopY family transcriptional regulator n=1 Tax=Fulvivirga ligni TaxID=2904246 RepID=UPI001F32F0C2|nr:BlaI/MecI/CopY family transcriptional regulator [Fulvivirga ligni]UII21369.1 BlaI/MecI/CopY family transcriptional regulator [Fulvivirga ligni]
MEKLTRTEEPVMQIIWKLEKVFVKDIIDKLLEPKPPYNTISSIVRGLESKGMVGHESFGRTHRYFPLVTKSSYKRLIFKSLLTDYFEGSYANLMSFMIKSNDLKEDEEKELRKLIDKHYGE